MQKPAGGRFRCGHSTFNKLPRPVALALTVLALFVVPSLAVASVITLAHQESEFVVEPALFDVYDYQRATTASFADLAQFEAGTFDSTDAITLDDEIVLSLAPAGSDALDGVTAPSVATTPWWSQAWEMRSCQRIDHNQAGAQTVTEYQIQFDLDLQTLVDGGHLQANFGDLRAVGGDGQTQLPLWADPTSSTIWVQVPSIAAGTSSTVCVYFDTADPQVALDIHSAEAVFTYSEAKRLYFAVQSGYNRTVIPEVAEPAEDDPAEPEALDPEAEDPEAEDLDAPADNAEADPAADPVVDDEPVEGDEAPAGEEPAEAEDPETDELAEAVEPAEAPEADPVADPEAEADPVLVGVDLSVAAIYDATRIEHNVGGFIVDYQLGAGEQRDLPGSTSTTVLSTTGPVSGRPTDAGFDTIVPISFATTSAIVPMSRGLQQLDFHAPFAASTVTIWSDGQREPVATIEVGADQQATWNETAELSNADTLTITATSPVLTVHSRPGDANAGDVFPVVGSEHGNLEGQNEPRFGLGQAVAGVGLIGADDETEISIDRTASGSGETESAATTSGGIINTGVADGEALSVHLSTSQPGIDPEALAVDGFSFGALLFGALSVGDTDASSLLRQSQLSNSYVVPTSVTGLEIACPQSGTRITITNSDGSTEPLTCDGNVVGGVVSTTDRAISTRVVVDDQLIANGRGILVSSDNGAPFSLVATADPEAGSSEQFNVLGVTQARQLTWPAPSTSQTIEGLFPATGTWRSPTIDIGDQNDGVYGQIRFSATELVADDGSAVGTTSVRLASGAELPLGTAVGPDGTSGSTYAVAADGTSTGVISTSHDGDQLAAVEVTFTTSDRTRSPVISLLEVDYNLEKITRNPGEPTTIVVDQALADGTTALVRLHSTNPAFAGTAALPITASAAITEVSGISLGEPLFDAMSGEAAAPGPVRFDVDHPASLGIDIGSGDPASLDSPSGSAQIELTIDLAGPGVRSVVDINLIVEP